MALNISEDRRGRHASHDVSRAGHLQKHCPVGSLAIASEVHQAIGIRAQMFRSPYSPELRESRAFICSRRQSMPYAERLLEGLTDLQKAAIPPLFALHWRHMVPESGLSLLDLRTIMSGPILVVLGDTNREPGSRVTPAATSDPAGLGELLASMQSNRDVVLAVDEWEDTPDLANSHSVVLLGSGLANAYASAINDLVEPIRFNKHDGLVFNRILAQGYDQHRHERQWAFGEHSLVGRNCGLVVLCRSPFSRRHHLLWIAGITGIATQAASLFVSDMGLEPRGTMQRAGVPEGFSPIACVVL